MEPQAERMRVSFVRRILLDDAPQSNTPLPRRALRARAGAHQHVLLLRSSRLRLCSTWACSERHPSGPPTASTIVRSGRAGVAADGNLSAAYSHYQQPCVKEPSVDNFREAMHGDAARTAALLLMIACSTDAPAAIRCPG